ncbi:MAG: hypothetical protein JOZ42_06150, partial [Acetobacteraceae bacterium]|nr:hypothetical protein [Acetobacteraceae bacterium]
MGAECPDFPTLVAPIHHWSRVRAAKRAFADGARCFDFATFADAVGRRVAVISSGDDPATAWVDTEAGVLDQLIEFCAIIATGRAAAIAGPDWTNAQRRAMRAALPREPFEQCEPVSERPFYAGFTSGTTGVPKGFLRSHRSWTESFRSA